MANIYLEIVWSSEENSGLKIDLWNHQFISNMQNHENRCKYLREKEKLNKG